MREKATVRVLGDRDTQSNRVIEADVIISGITRRKVFVVPENMNQNEIQEYIGELIRKDRQEREFVEFEVNL